MQSNPSRIMSSDWCASLICRRMPGYLCRKPGRAGSRKCRAWVPSTSVTDAVKALEARLGVRLLQRTTRQVSPTLDGEAYYQRCVSLIADMEEAEGAFAGAKPSGLIRIDVHGTQARHFLLPA